MRDVLLLSTSTVHGSRFLEYAEDDIRSFFPDGATVLFVPFARPGGITHDGYTELRANAFR